MKRKFGSYVVTTAVTTAAVLACMWTICACAQAQDKGEQKKTSSAPGYAQK
jgi:hypothetical protein